MNPKNSQDTRCAPSGANRLDEALAHGGEGALIYGKEACPHTRRARAALPRAQFVDVLADPAALTEMLRLSGGVRRIPVIASGNAATVGFQRGS